MCEESCYSYRKSPYAGIIRIRLKGSVNFRLSRKAAPPYSLVGHIILPPKNFVKGFSKMKV